MLVDVVCMRDRGDRLSAEVVAAAAPVRGELSIKSHRGLNQYGQRVGLIVAQLTSVGPGQLDVPELIHATITNLANDTFTVAGTEVHTMHPYGSSSSWGQTWLCRLVKA